MKMRNEFKYLVAAAAIGILFTHFIACGAQMYKAKVDDDNSQAGISAEAKDPSSPIYGLHAPGGWTSLPITYYYQADMTDAQKDGIKSAISIWEKATGRTLFKIGGNAGKRGDDFPDLYTSLKDSVNGFYLDYNWGKTGKTDIVLATTIWSYASDASKVNFADMRYNRREYRPCNSLTLKGCDLKGKDAYGKQEETKQVYDMTTVSLHELGHFLGLLHIDESYDSQSIMGPSIFIGEGLAQRTLSVGDITRIRRIYAPPSGYMSAEDMAKQLQKDANQGNYGLSAQNEVAH